jgi:hypothetical protein
MESHVQLFSFIPVSLNKATVLEHRDSRITWLLMESHVQLFSFIPISWNKITILKYRDPRTTERRQAVAALALTLCPWKRCQDIGMYVPTPVQSGT